MLYNFLICSKTKEVYFTTRQLAFMNILSLSIIKIKFLKLITQSGNQPISLQ